MASTVEDALEGLIQLDRYETVNVQRTESIALITLDRPRYLNALDVSTGQQLRQAFEWAEADRSIRVVVLTGTGDRAFSAGADLSGIAAEGGRPLATEEIPVIPGASLELSERLLTTPTIAAVNGLAYGGGFELALACDLIVAADTATFALSEVRRGLMAAGGGVLRLTRQLPTKIALEILLTGEPISAGRAAELGLVNRVVTGPEVLAESFRLAGLIGRNAPLAVAATKQLAYRGTDVPLYQGPNAWDVGRTMSAALMASQDAREGARAFIEKRAPTWSGR
jgi:crotonobetainyl-CoA hydratase